MRVSIAVESCTISLILITRELVEFNTTGKQLITDKEQIIKHQDIKSSSKQGLP